MPRVIKEDTIVDCKVVIETLWQSKVLQTTEQEGNKVENTESFLPKGNTQNVWQPFIIS